MGYTADSTSHWGEALREVSGRRALQQKTEEASMTTKRLKELLESRKASSQYTFGNSNGSGSMSTLKSCIFAKKHITTTIKTLHRLTMLALCSNHVFL
ncbi:putative kinesin-like protein [Helianthus anomalus]